MHKWPQSKEGKNTWWWEETGGRGEQKKGSRKLNKITVLPIVSLYFKTWLKFSKLDANNWKLEALKIWNWNFNLKIENWKLPVAENLHLPLTSAFVWSVFFSVSERTWSTSYILLEIVLIDNNTSPYNIFIFKIFFLSVLFVLLLYALTYVAFCLFSCHVNTQAVLSHIKITS